MEFTISETTYKIIYVLRNPLTPAMYHGANSFAKEYYREKTYAGFSPGYVVV